MASTPIGNGTTPYESADELREANVQLLEALNQRLGEDSSAEGEAAALLALEPQVRTFLARGAATGALVEDIKDRTACQVLLDYWVSSLSHALPDVPRAHFAAFDAAQLPELKDSLYPYDGLDASRDRKLFFGRERALESLLERVAATPLVVVQGASGSGKSSIVTGAALPVLSAPQHVPRYRVVGPFTPGNAVLERLVEAVAHAVPRPNADVEAEVALLRSDPGHLVAMVGGTGAPAVLLVIDQFSEVFTLSDQRDRNALAASLAALLKASRDNRVILTLREEFSSRLDELVAWQHYLKLHARFSMSDWPMGYDDLVAAVQGPATAVNLQFQPGIVDEMVKGVLGERAALSLLQFTLNLLWKNRVHNRITWDTYKKIGGSPKAALETFADAFYAGLGSGEDRDQVKRILLELVEIDRLLQAHRQPVLRRSLLGSGTSATQARTNEVMELLERNDLVRITPTPDGRDAVVEVKHEALVRNWPLFATWIDAKRERVRQRIAVSEAAQRWERGGRSASENLLTGWQLQEVANIPDLPEFEREYIEVSRKAVERKAHRKLWGAVMATVVGVVVVGIVSWTVVGNRQALHNEQRRILLRTMATAREAAINFKLDHAFTAALESTSSKQDHGSGEEVDTLQFERRLTMLSVLRDSGDVRRIFLDSGAVFQSVVFQPKRKDAVVVFAGSGGKAYVAGLDQPVEDTLDACGSVLVTSVAFDPQGRWLAAGCADGKLAVWSTTAPKWKRLGATRQIFDRTIWAIAFSPDGRLLAAGGFENKVKLIELAEDGTPLDQEPLVPAGDKPEGSIWSMAFSPVEETLLVGDGAGRILACDSKPDAHWRCTKSKAYPESPEDAIRALVFSGDGRRVAVGHWNGAVEIWDAGLSGKRSPIDAGQVPVPVFSLAFTENCGLSYLAVGKGAGLHYYKVGEAEPYPERRPSPERCIDRPYASVGDEVYGVAFHSPSGLMAAATRGGYVAVIDPAGQVDRIRTIVPVPTKPNEQVRGAIVSEKDETARLVIPIAPTQPDKHNVVMLSVRKGRLVGGDELRATLPVGAGEILRVSASATTRLLATLSLEPDARPSLHTVAVWRFDEDFRRVSEVWKLSAGDFEGMTPKRIALSPDGKWLAVSLGPLARASIGAAPTVGEWCKRNPRATQLLVLSVGERGARTWVDTNLCSARHDMEIAFSPDSEMFAAGGDELRPRSEGGAGGVQVWTVDPAGFRRQDLDMQMTPLANTVSDVAFAAPKNGSRLLAAGGEYGAIDLWDLRTSARGQYRIDSRPVWLLAFGPGGAGLAASDSRHLVRLSSVTRPDPKIKRSDPEPMQLSSAVERLGIPGFLAFSGNGDWLASGAGSAVGGGTLHLWDLDVESLRGKVCALLREPGQHGAEVPDPPRISACRSP